MNILVARTKMQRDLMRRNQSFIKMLDVHTNNSNYLISLQNSNKTSEEELFEYICSDINTKEMSAMENCYNFEDTYNKDMPEKKQCFNCIR